MLLLRYSIMPQVSIQNRSKQEKSIATYQQLSVTESSYYASTNTQNSRKEDVMKNDIIEQINKWRKRKQYYEEKESLLRSRIQKMEKDRTSIDTMSPGSPIPVKFYRQLNGLYTQLSTLPAKINKCNNYIQTLQSAASWN